MGIFAPLKGKALNIKKNISKKMVLHLALFIAIIGVASLFDVYFENNPEKAKEMQTESAANSSDRTKMYFVSQTNFFSTKSSDQKDTGRKLQVKLHDKFIQKYHQLRNFQVLKAEVQTQTTPLILAYHYLIFQNYFFTIPDDEPLIS